MPGGSDVKGCNAAWSQQHRQHVLVVLASLLTRPTPCLPAPAQAQLLLVGDSLGLYRALSWRQLAADAATSAYDALLHIGDLGYDLAAAQGRRGTAFLRMVSRMAAATPYLAAPGNHEWHWGFAHYR